MKLLFSAGPSLQREDGGGRLYQQSGLFTQAHFFLLDDLRLVKVGHDVFAVAFLFGIRLPGAVELEEFLDAAVARGDDVAALLDHAVFGLDFFEQVGDFGGEVCHCGGWSVFCG